MPSLLLFALAFAACEGKGSGRGRRRRSDASKDPSWYYALASKPRSLIEMLDPRGLIDRRERWESGGEQQLAFLQKQGMLPEHSLLDLACGVLRGGVHFVGYLDTGRYYGIDINPAFLDIGYDVELEGAGLQHKLPRDHLAVSKTYEMSRFGVKFDFIFAYSLLTHLPPGEVELCVKKAAEALRPGTGRFFATAFVAGEREAGSPVRQNDYKGRYTDQYGEFSYHDKDPYHHTMPALQALASANGLRARSLGKFGPDNHEMVEFRPAAAGAPEGEL